MEWDGRRLALRATDEDGEQTERVGTERGVARRMPKFCRLVEARRSEAEQVLPESRPASGLGVPFEATTTTTTTTTTTMTTTMTMVAAVAEGERPTNQAFHSQI